MYKEITVEDTVRVPPEKFERDVEDSVLEVLREKYESKIDEEEGVVLTVTNIEDVSEGKVIPGDGSTYHDLKFDAIVFKPEMHEVITAEVSEIVQFGAFVRIGPIDGLIHVSQIMDDYMAFDEKNGVLSAKESNRTLQEGDTVRARIVTISLKENLNDSKIGLTTRQPGLGKLEWIKEEKEEEEEGEKEEE